MITPMKTLSLFISLLIFSTFVSGQEKYISLTDLTLYAGRKTAEKLSVQLEKWTRDEFAKKSEILKTQKLISIRPQDNFEAGKKITFTLFFLHNTRSLKSTSLLVQVTGFLNNSLDQLENIQITGETPLSQTQFSVEVSLLELVAKLKDKTTGSTFIYPVGGSAFDKGVLPRSHGKTIFASPAFSGVMPRSQATESRKEPHYYRGKPFLTIQPLTGAGSLFGFHTTPFSHLDKKLDVDELARGFVSAGCLRLKDDDLSELYQIVAFGGLKDVPVQIKYATEWTDQHPYPILKDGYHQVTGYCWKVGEGSSPCLKEFHPGSRTVFSTAWVKKDPQSMIKELYDYGQAKVSSKGFEIPPPK